MSEAIDYFSYNNPFIKVKTFFSLKARKKMYRIFEQICCPDETMKTVDIGATPDEKLADSNFFEKLYPYRNNLTIVSIEDCSSLVKKFGLAGFVQNKSKERLPFADKAFDILFCSAVLEHVGTREDQKYFIDECLRVSKKIFLTTPNRYFPLEMHTFIPFLHWLPWSIFQKIVRRTKGEFWADINNLNLLSKKDIEIMYGDKLKITYVHTMGMKSNLIITN
jgi:SAM-dependent methyltransferase